MDPATFLTELKRRKVYRVAVAYAIVAWLLIQAASILFPTFEAPPWVMKVFVTAVILGFPVALILAWAFELTPEGLRRSEEVAPRESKTRKPGSKWTAVIVTAALLATALLAFQFVRTRRSPAIEPAKQTAPTATLDKSVAVLPFENLSSDKENAFFAQGIQDEIITTLSRIGGLRVISRTSTARYSSAPENLPEIARQLRVSNVLEGSVQKAGDRVHTRNLNPTTHTRLPRYARGKFGTVEAVRGCHVYPDAAAIGAGDNPQWLYAVVFPARELWGEAADPAITVSIEAFEPYLEPA